MKLGEYISVVTKVLAEQIAVTITEEVERAQLVRNANLTEDTFGAAKAIVARILANRRELLGVYDKPGSPGKMRKRNIRDADLIRHVMQVHADLHCFGTQADSNDSNPVNELVRRLADNLRDRLLSVEHEPVYEKPPIPVNDSNGESGRAVRDFMLPPRPETEHPDIASQTKRALAARQQAAVINDDVLKDIRELDEGLRRRGIIK